MNNNTKNIYTLDSKGYLLSMIKISNFFIWKIDDLTGSMSRYNKNRYHSGFN